MKPSIRTCAAAALLLAAAGAHAQQPPVYKSIMPDGKVIYGEKPVPGAKRVDTIDPPPAKTGVTPLPPEHKSMAGQQSNARAAAATQQATLEDARKQLRAAEAAREAGKEPLAGERQGIVGGGSRLTDAYHERQKNLEAAVQAAKKRLSDMQASK